MIAIEKLKTMVGKPFTYKGDSIVITGYKQAAGSKNDMMNIFLGNGTIIEISFGDLVIELAKFKPLDSGMAMVPFKSDSNALNIINDNILTTLRDTILDNLKKVQEDPKHIPQAKQIFQGINTILNIAKTEIAYSKFIEKGKES